MNTALQRAVELLADPPSNPDVSKGYLDLLGSTPATEADPPKNTGRHPGGVGLAHRVDALRQGADLRAQVDDRLSAPDGVAGHPAGRRRTRCRQRARQRDRFAGACRRAGGLALGVDISEPMLARAVRAEAGPQVGFLRADAQRLPFRDETFDAVMSIAMLQLIPKPSAALAEMARVLRPGGRMAVMVPTGPTCRRADAAAARRRSPFLHRRRNRATPSRISASSECGRRAVGTIQWVRGKRP